MPIFLFLVRMGNCPHVSNDVQKPRIRSTHFRNRERIHAMFLFCVQTLLVSFSFLVAFRFLFKIYNLQCPDGGKTSFDTEL